MEYIFFTLSPCTDKDITKLQRLQNRGLRICLHAAPRSLVLKLHSLKQRHRFIYCENSLYRRIILIGILGPSWDHSLLIYFPEVLGSKNPSVGLNSACGRSSLPMFDVLPTLRNLLMTWRGYHLMSKSVIIIKNLELMRTKKSSPNCGEYNLN